MKATFATAGLCTMVLALALPAMLLAQEPAPAPVPGEAAPTEPAPPPPPPEAEPPAAEPPVVEETPAAEGQAETEAAPVLAKASATVQMVDYAFSPASVSINVGDSITWSNTGEEDHDAAGNGFSTGTVIPGGSGSATFSTAGTIPYVCSFHPDMKGTIVVNDPNAGTEQKTDDGAVDPTTGAPVAGTEAEAVNSADAAGTTDALPASGEEEAPLLILGVGLLACGAVTAALARWRSRETALP